MTHRDTVVSNWRSYGHEYIRQRCIGLFNWMRCVNLQATSVKAQTLRWWHAHCWDFLFDQTLWICEYMNFFFFAKMYVLILFEIAPITRHSLDNHSFKKKFFFIRMMIYLFFGHIVYLFSWPVRWCQQHSCSSRGSHRADSWFDWQSWRLETLPQPLATHTHTHIMKDIAKQI